MVSVSWNKPAHSSAWKPSCPCPTQSEIHPRELMVCSLEMGAFWDKNSLVSGTVNFSHPQAKIAKDDSQISQGVWLWGRAGSARAIKSCWQTAVNHMTPEWLTSPQLELVSWQLVFKCETDGFVSSPLLRIWTNSKQSQMFELNAVPHLHFNLIKKKKNQLHPEIVRNKQQNRKWRQWLKTLCDSSVMCGGFLTNECSKQLPAGTGNESDVSEAKPNH